MNENSHTQATVSGAWRSNVSAPPIHPSTTKRNAVQAAELQRLKVKLLQPVLEETIEPQLCHQFELAANEAVAEAWGKPFPFLRLGCLWEEKVRQARCWFKRQQQILNHTHSASAPSERA